MAQQDATIEARFLAVKEHRVRGKYQRVFGLSAKGFINSDPTTGKLTNSWTYEQLKDLRVVAASETQFQVVLPKELPHRIHMREGG